MEWNALSITIVILELALIPFAWKIWESLNTISNTSREFSTSMTRFCETLTKISEELVEARIRDKDMQAELENIKRELQVHVDDERRK